MYVGGFLCASCKYNNFMSFFCSAVEVVIFISQSKLPDQPANNDNPYNMIVN